MIDYYDAIELATMVVGADPDALGTNLDELEEKLCEQFNISLDDFHNLVCKLAPFTHPWKSELSGKTYKGFINPNTPFVIAKIEV